ncbi:MAG: hypothetical protein ACM3SW_02055 [Actinomycetota bacterium]
MDPQLKVVTRLPLQELWTKDGLVSSARGRSLTAEDISNLLRMGPLIFVIADVGMAPHWIEPGKCCEFWKEEAKPHLAKTVGATLSEHPGSYCYFATEWSREKESAPIVLLEKHH